MFQVMDQLAKSANILVEKSATPEKTMPCVAISLNAIGYDGIMSNELKTASSNCRQMGFLVAGFYAPKTGNDDMHHFYEIAKRLKDVVSIFVAQEPSKDVTSLLNKPYYGMLVGIETAALAEKIRIDWGKSIIVGSNSSDYRMAESIAGVKYYHVIAFANKFQ